MTKQERAEELHAIATRLEPLYRRTKSTYLLERIGRLRKAAYELEDQSTE